MLELLFGNQNVERILFTLQVNKRCYATKISDECETSLYGVQAALQKLEKAGVLVSYTEGKLRLYEYNPRYPFVKELKQFINKAYYFLPSEIKAKYYTPSQRKRPRRTGKPL
ncbi:ArsR family transcriptional regulator [Candidatus Margulisiibacteriota bacterium]